MSLESYYHSPKGILGKHLQWGSKWTGTAEDWHHWKTANMVFEAQGEDFLFPGRGHAPRQHLICAGPIYAEIWGHQTRASRDSGLTHNITMATDLSIESTFWGHSYNIFLAGVAMNVLEKKAYL